MNDTLTVLVLFGLVTLYSTMGGIRGVILTDRPVRDRDGASIAFAYRRCRRSAESPG